MLKNSISCFYMFADTEETGYRTKQTEAIADHLGDVEEEGDDTGGGEEHIRGKLKVLKFALIVLLNFIFCKKKWHQNCQKYVVELHVTIIKSMSGETTQSYTNMNFNPPVPGLRPNLQLCSWSQPGGKGSLQRPEPTSIAPQRHPSFSFQNISARFLSTTLSCVYLQCCPALTFFF